MKCPDSDLITPVHGHELGELPLGCHHCAKHAGTRGGSAFAVLAVVAIVIALMLAVIAMFLVSRGARPT